MQCKRMVSGEITAFLSLIFVLLISFIFALLESATIQTTKNQKRLDVDRAIFSIFGEYQKELWKEYEVFALDASYQSGQYDENRILDRLAYYGSAGIEQEISEIQMLTDNQGQAFREQVLAFMEQQTGIQSIQNMIGLSAQWEEREIEGSQLTEQMENELLQNGSVIEEEASELLQTKASGLLALALPKKFILSNRSISKEQQLSSRTLNGGRGSFPARVGVGGLEERVLFEQYIEQHFSSAIEKKSENRTLDYEMEYILCGKSSDKENLEAVIKRLMAARFALNYGYLMGSVQRQEEAAALAATIAVILLQPELMETAKQIILMLWGFGESVIDIRALLSGNRVAMIKDDSNWQLQLSSLFLLGTALDAQEGRDDESGMKYTQYLQMLLLLKQNSEITMRTLDRVEENLIYENNLGYFRADSCVTRMKLQNKAEIWNGKTYQFPCKFGYESR